MPRISELAGAAGVTPQQVRNYLDQGLLPPADRAENGYRIFTERHAHALRTVRVLAAGHGWGRAREIMRAVHSGQPEEAAAVIDASHAEVHRERGEVAAARGAFEVVVGRRTEDGVVRIGKVAEGLGVAAPVVRQWEARGLLSPVRDRSGYRVYDATEQRIAHLVAVLRRGGYPFAIIGAATAALRADGDPARALVELARRDRDLHRSSLARLRGSAALSDYLDAYPASAPTAATVSTRPVPLS